MSKRTDNKGRKLPDGISQRSDGRYQARFTHSGKRYCIYDEELNRLKKRLLQKKVDLQNGIAEMVEYTLNEWYDKWIVIYKGEKIKDSTLAIYKAHYDRYIREGLGRQKIAKIKQMQIKDLYRTLQEGERGITSGTIKNIHNILRQLFETARRNDIVLKNPTDGLLKEIKRTSPQGQRALTVQEQDLFFKYLNHDKWIHHKAMFTVLFGTGIRVGEMGGLTWSDIDFKKNCIYIKRTLCYLKDAKTGKMRRALQTPKSESSLRTLEMLPEVRKAFLSQKQMQMMLGVKTGIEVDGIKGFCFTSRTGSPRIETDVYKIIEYIISDINSGRKEESRLLMFTPHCTRHTYATRCFEAGMSPKTVQGLLGHSKIGMTLDIYTHVTEEKMTSELKLLTNMKIS